MLSTTNFIFTTFPFSLASYHVAKSCHVKEESVQLCTFLSKILVATEEYKSGNKYFYCHLSSLRVEERTVNMNSECFYKNFESSEL